MLYAHRHSTAARGVWDRTYSHTSAARVHKLHLWEVDSLVHITSVSNVSDSSNAGHVRNYSALLQPFEVIRKAGLRVTSVERTVVDCARIMPHKQALVIAEHALWTGADRSVMLKIISSLTGHKGVHRARKVVANASALSESPGETLALNVIRSMRLPMPVQQWAVSTRHGAHRLDFAWPEQKEEIHARILTVPRVALEFDGRTKYFYYAPTDEVLFQERRRKKALTEEG
ncbi:hypothetical protein [Arthrobacter sp. H5]|uniref:hypothetical protein n=1 Tax=Arthrobacter sp. H5 TaxID=1267973 RepID=UPI0012DE08FE|nr:hypothetical protein [Arthrobacter sp. H5]